MRANHKNMNDRVQLQTRGGNFVIPKIQEHIAEWSNTKNDRIQLADRKH